MAITRSRNAPKKESGEVAVPFSQLHNGGEIAASSSYNLDVDKTASSFDKALKPKKVFKHPKKAERGSRHSKFKLGDEDLSNGRNIKTDSDIIKSEIFRSASVDTKGKKLPAYKVEQLQRLQKLINMSLVAKPRGPVTYNDYVSQKDDRSADNALRIRIDGTNKAKISNVTHYNPVRQRLLEGKLTESEKAEMAQTYEKIRKYGNIRAPKLSDDKTLKKVLGEIVDKNKELMFWDYFNERLQAEGYGNAVLFENECRLQTHEITSTQRDNLNKQKYQQKESQAIEVKTEKDSGSVKDISGKYTKINLMKAAGDTELQKMLEEVSNGAEKYSAANEENAFSGLKLVDFTTIRNFNHEKA
ncbi:hypothetical protein PICMEDRAFT_175568 [Pichia membranifaciens NRRL Y-2026]|uniref:Uncharacterized protein n=1 Tax=Pichia membranifaciens NRRL Y-2026 TaxID=763406 RepID=A0A1E3NF09_9ASCO|nr:hypothetical protein PICMEDRAFT_175568 [Pichia membranifaciens NRRL Y-2026]ODQ44709.1 hypothetical protein PICMEDRAFT_175568 [Pichia membranifaciens NRRL Y-2026]